MKNNDYEINIPAKCMVCGNDVLTDKFGQGKCSACGWKQSYDGLDFPDIVRYPNRISYNKAKQLYKQGKPFIPTLEDFIGGLFFYSEMQFDYKCRRFGADLNSDYSIDFYEDNTDENRTYKTKEEFMETATIDGLLLKDIWSDVRNAYYMLCVEIPPSDKEEDI